MEFLPLGESITVILVSEIGDKTFFIAAILAMRNNKLTVFLAAVSALFLMTVLSGLLGWVVTTFIPRSVLKLGGHNECISYLAPGSTPTTHVQLSCLHLD